MDEGLSPRRLLAEVRSAFEHEIALAGAMVVMDPRPAESQANNPPRVSHQATPHPQPHPRVVTSEEASISKEVDNSAGFAEGLGAFSDGSNASLADRFEALIPPNSPLRALQTLSEVEAWTAATVLIPLDEQRLNPVFGVGDPEADLMVIGEAPGADEDRQGEPFVGRAGQLLTQILAAIGFERGEVYIANILKSRPPNNRDPLPTEVEAHLPILHKQIALIRPRLILCVGKTAGNSLLGVTSSLKSLRGRFHDYHGVPVMVTYHPAALLRNPQWKRPTWEDVQKLRALYDRLTEDDARVSR